MSTSNNYLSDFGSRLAAMLKEERLNQEEFAGKIGVSQSAVNKWIHGTPPGSAELLKIARFFNVSLDTLTGWEPAEELRKRFIGVAELAASVPGTFEEQQEFHSALLAGLVPVRFHLKEARQNLDEADRFIAHLDNSIKKIRPKNINSAVGDVVKAVTAELAKKQRDQKTQRSGKAAKRDPSSPLPTGDAGRDSNRQSVPPNREVK